MTQRTPILNLVLVRSGRTEWDLAGRLAGHSDHPLSDSGREELLAAIDAAELPPIGLVLHGPDEASASTATILAAKTGAPRTRGLAGLTEVDLGLWCGLGAGVLEDRYCSAFRQWRDDPSAVSVPEGEPIGDAESRVAKAVAGAVERVKPNGHAVAIVLRPVVFQLLRRRMLDRPLSDVWDSSLGRPVLEQYQVDPRLLKPRPVQAGA
jgi:broad specificity phosphatase PhoE